MKTEKWLDTKIFVKHDHEGQTIRESIKKGADPCILWQLTHEGCDGNCQACLCRKEAKNAGTGV